MRRTARKLVKCSLTCEEYETKGIYSPTTVCRRFGGWNSALLKAGLLVNRLHKMSDAELFDNLKKVWDSLRRQPKGYELQKPLSLYTVNVYTRRFGSWLRALYAFQAYIKNGGEGRYQNMNGTEANYTVPVKNKAQTISKGMRFDVLKRDNYRCQICGASPATDPKVKLHVDHIIPISKGGLTILSNLHTCCDNCNLGKGTKDMNISSPSGSLS